MDSLSRPGGTGLELQAKEAEARGSEVQSQPRKLTETVSECLKKWHWEDAQRLNGFCTCRGLLLGSQKSGGLQATITSATGHVIPSSGP